MLDLAWQTIRSRLGGFAGAFIAILCGTALVAACGILMESGLRAGVPTQRYADAAVVVGGERSVQPPGADALSAEQVGEEPSVPAALAGRIAAVPGVRAAVAEQSFPAHVVTGDGQVLGGAQSWGHNWDAAVLAPFRLSAGAAPAAPDEVVLDASVAQRGRRRRRRAGADHDPLGAGGVPGERRRRQPVAAVGAVLHAGACRGPGRAARPGARDRRAGRPRRGAGRAGRTGARGRGPRRGHHGGRAQQRRVPGRQPDPHAAAGDRRLVRRFCVARRGFCGGQHAGADDQPAPPGVRAAAGDRGDAEADPQADRHRDDAGRARRRRARQRAGAGGRVRTARRVRRDRHHPGGLRAGDRPAPAGRGAAAQPGRGPAGRVGGVAAAVVDPAGRGARRGVGGTA